MIVGCCALAGRSGHEAGRKLLERLYYEETGQALPVTGGQIMLN